MYPKRMKPAITNILAYTLIIAGAIFTAKANSLPQLKLVNVVFRHGDRAPDPVEMFPNDPHYNDTFYPMGLGGLTNNGKLREYQLGKLLRDRYNDFLGDLYLPESVWARSTDYKRTKMCLQLVLSSLYPPRGRQQWNNQLNWQPIPMSYVSTTKDWLMIPEECPEYLDERQIAESMPEIVAKIESFRDFMNDLSEWTGKNISTTNDMYNLYHILAAESSMNLTLPEWTHNIFPYGKLYDGINLEYEIFSYTTAMRRLNGGKLLYHMIEKMKAVTAGELDKTRKISLYSGHETNIVAVLQTLGVYKPHVPQYTSAVIVELYEYHSQYYVKVLYYLGIPSTVVAQRIPGCDILCPLDKFLDLLSDVLPSREEMICNKRKKPVELTDIDNDVLRQ